jgi:hypothetical protein
MKNGFLKPCRTAGGDIPTASCPEHFKTAGSMAVFDVTRHEARF